jgi:metal-sulfur cluster biosynthetic enzyme
MVDSAWKSGDRVSIQTERLTVEAVYEALDTVKDPCMEAAGLDLSVLDLGLVYGVEVQEDGRVRVDMTLTEIGCIFTHRVIGAAYDAVEALPETKEVEVVPRWAPVWTEERLNQKARRAFEGSRNAMFRTIKRRGLDADEKIDRRPEDWVQARLKAAHGTPDS